MKFLALILLVAAAAQASLVSTITASTGVPQPATVCRDTYTAPPESPSFDRSCFAPNPVVPARFAYAEVSAQGPMHLFLETIGGVTASGCTPLDGCPDGFAQLSYNDVWTITGGTGAGTLGLFFTSSGARDFRLSDISVQGNLELGTNSFLPVFVPFVYGQPFSFSFRAEMFSSDLGYGQNMWFLDVTPAFYEGACNDPFVCSQMPAVAGTVASQIGNPFVVTPEPATSGLAGWMLATAMAVRRLRLRTNCGAANPASTRPSSRLV